MSIEILLAAGLVTVCETCDGSGWVAVVGTTHPDTGQPLVSDIECLDCDARGWLFDPDRLEAALNAAETAYESRGPMIRAALLAYLTE